MKSSAYQRQRERNRADRAYCVIDGKRIQLGAYDSPASHAKFAELISQPGPTVEQGITASNETADRMATWLQKWPFELISQEWTRREAGEEPNYAIVNSLERPADQLASKTVSMLPVNSVKHAVIK